VYQKDFMQEYLLARAVLAGADPYLPMPELGGRFLEPLPVELMSNPTPHPPPVALLSLPFGLLPYIPAAAAWYLFEVVCIGLAVTLLLYWLFGRPKRIHILGSVLFVFLWSPFKDELAVGQLMSLLLLLLVGAWLAMRVGQDLRGGMLLGLVLALKLFAWPILIYLFLSRRWRAAAAAIVTVLAANIGAGFLMGFDRVLSYYLQVGPQVEPLYRSHERNFSAWSLGFRIFEGTSSPAIAGIEAPPLLDAPVLAPLASAIAVGLLVVLALFLALRIRHFDSSFGVLVCASLLVNPVAWSHYLILATLPLTIVVSRLSLLNLKRWESLALILIGSLLFVGAGLRSLLFLFNNSSIGSGTSIQVSFPASLLTLAPALGILGLFWVIWRSDKVTPIRSL
jgi:hypothetical protein